MRERLSRRGFLAGAGAVLAAPPLLFAQKEVPQMLDHILLGTKDLDAGIAYVERRTGMRAAFGGVHPGRGTRNALLSLGERRYLEIIAPDPQQPGAADTYGLQALDSPRVVTWAAHVQDIEETARQLRAAGIAFEGPNAGSRARPDGRVLHWRTLVLKDSHHGMLPFFIEWSADSVHPSVDAPQGCRLTRFEAATPDLAGLTKLFESAGLDVPVVDGKRAELRAAIVGNRGGFEIVS
jgi:catechol 2,3-dioxygenase-like lactoylglutathione lyase family enzyme